MGAGGGLALDCIILIRKFIRQLLVLGKASFDESCKQLAHVLQKAGESLKCFNFFMICAKLQNQTERLPNGHF